jgi:hypothetical protein
MRILSRLALVTAGAVTLALGGQASADPSTPFGGPTFQTFVTAMETVRGMYVDETSAEVVAIDKAIAYFSDPSSGYSEDLNDFRLALKVLRPVFGSDGNDPDSNKALAAGFMNQAVAYGYTTLLGLANESYASLSPFAKLKLLAKYDKASKIKNEQARFNKYKAYMNAIQKNANKKGIDLYS